MSKLCCRTEMRSVLLEAVLLVALAFAIGFSSNYSLVMNAFSGKVLSEHITQDNKVEEKGQAGELYPEPVGMDETRELLSLGALAIDARNINDYKAGHIAGAVAFPLGEYAAEIVDFRGRVDKDRTLIVYCNGFDCPDSFDLGLLLCQEGYQQVLVYEGGFPEWRDAGQPIEVEP